MPEPAKSRPIFSHPRGRLRVLARLVLDPLAAILHWLSRRHLAEGRPQMVVFAFDHIGHTINIDGLYERDELECFVAWLAAAGVSLRDAVMLDIGANIGNHSVFFAPYCGRIVAYEPNPRTFQVLSLNAQVAPNIECRKKALSDRSGHARLSEDPRNVGSATLAPAASAAGEGPLVDIVALDDEADLGTIRLIKLDVEGHELQALKGATALLASHRPIVLFEQHPRDFVDGRSAVIELLRSQGYLRFAKVSKRPRFSGHALARWLATPLARLIVGESVVVEVREQIEPDFYFFLVALPDWVMVPEPR